MASIHESQSGHGLLHEGRGNQSKSEKYRVVRKAAPLDTVAHIYHTLGIQSNVIVAATYRSELSSQIPNKTQRLSKSTVYPAIEQVIRQHAALGLIGVHLPSEKNPGNSTLWEARLKSIDLDSCVEFIDDNPYLSNDSITILLERLHNTWHWSHNNDSGQEEQNAGVLKPWWRIYVVNGSHIVFLFHHFICDGISGLEFHRCFLEALNSGPPKGEPGDSSSPKQHVVVVPSCQPPAHTHDLIVEKLSWFYIVYTLLFWVVARILLSKSWLLFSDATFEDWHADLKSPLPPQKRTKTGMRSLRIPPAMMKQLLQMCSDYNTTFTALLATLIQITLATDIYPQSKIGFCRIAVNVRPLLQQQQGKSQGGNMQRVMMNAAGSFNPTPLLSPFKKAGTNASGTRMTSEVTDPRSLRLNADLTWKLAINFKERLRKYVFEEKTVLQDFLSESLMGADDEEIVQNVLGNLGMYVNYSFLVSNLGHFAPNIKPAVSGGKSTWKIDDVQFSAGVIKAALGEVGTIFNVVSVEEGDCVLNVVYEQGVLESRVVETILEGVRLRIGALVKDNAPRILS